MHRNVIRRYVVENFLLGHDGGLSDEASLLDAGVIDSTGVLQLVAFIEERFGIEVADEDLVPANLDSIANIARFVAQRAAVQAA